MKTAITLGIIACTVTLAAQSANAADYPNRSVRIIVPFGAGSATDVVGRTVGQSLAELLGQAVIIGNAGLSPERESLYLDLFEEYKPDGKKQTYLGLQAFSSWLLFAESAKQCGNDLTRKCVYETAKKVTEWDGGGLHSKQNPSSGRAGECFLIEQATPDGFKNPNVSPNDGIFNCDKSNVYVLQGDYPQGVTLADVGKSMSDLK